VLREPGPRALGELLIDLEEDRFARRSSSGCCRGHFAVVGGDSNRSLVVATAVGAT